MRDRTERFPHVPALFPDVPCLAFSSAKTHNKAIPFSVYVDLCTQALGEATPEFRFLHRLMVLSWNLCRDVELITNLTVEDLTFDNDSILVRLPKRSPASSASGTPYEEYEYCRVYANPIGAQS